MNKSTYPWKTIKTFSDILFEQFESMAKITINPSQGVQCF